MKSILPSPEQMRRVKSLGVLGDWIYATNLWHINRYSASMGFFVGLFMAFMPIPGQTVLAALLAVRLRCNLPLAVSLVWITNPVTVTPLFYLAYRVGALIVDVPVKDIDFEVSFHWLGNSLAAIWQPFLLGCLVCGLFFGCLGFFLVNQLWRWRVTFRWQKRRRERASIAAIPRVEPVKQRSRSIYRS